MRTPPAGGRPTPWRDSPGAAPQFPGFPILANAATNVAQEGKSFHMKNVTESAACPLLEAVATVID